MPSKDQLENFSADELRWMLVEKRRAARAERMERFRRSGRAVILARDVDSTPLEAIGAGVVADEPPQSRPARPFSRRIFDGFLLMVELAAVVGFIYIVYSSFGLLQSLNREVALAQVQPTLTPTPLVVAVVLPSGHTPPDDQGQTRPNDAEIPEHLRPLVQSLANLPIPTPYPDQAVRIHIPAINVYAPVVQGDGWEQLKMGVGQHIGTADPGEKGNLVLSAHNDIYGEIFRELDKLQPGDQVTVFTAQRSYVYVVTGTQVVEPTRVEVMAPTREPTLTLISCYPYLVDNQRIVVTARLLEGSAP